jgi:hypothetical protein
MWQSLTLVFIIDFEGLIANSSNLSLLIYGTNLTKLYVFYIFNFWSSDYILQGYHHWWTWFAFSGAPCISYIYHPCTSYTDPRNICKTNSPCINLLPHLHQTLVWLHGVQQMASLLLFRGACSRQSFFMFPGDKGSLVPNQPSEVIFKGRLLIHPFQLSL